MVAVKLNLIIAFNEVVKGRSACKGVLSNKFLNHPVVVKNSRVDGNRIRLISDARRIQYKYEFRSLRHSFKGRSHLLLYSIPTCTQKDLLVVLTHMMPEWNYLLLMPDDGDTFFYLSGHIGGLRRIVEAR